MKIFHGKVARDTLRTVLIFAVRLVTQAGTLILLASQLGPARFGEFSAIAALAVLIGTLSTLGTHLVLLGETAINPERSSDVLRYAIPTTLVCGGGLFVGYLAIVRALFHIEGFGFSVVFLVGLAELIFQPLNVLACGELQGSGKISKAQSLLNIPLLARLVVLLLFWVFGQKNFMTGFSFCYAASTFVSHFYVRKQLPRPWPGINKWIFPTTKIIKNCVGYALLQLSNSGNSELDKALAFKLVGPERTGAYTACSRILGALSMPVVALTVSAIPRLFRKGSAGNGFQILFVSVATCYGVFLGGGFYVTGRYSGDVFGGGYAQMGETFSLLALMLPATCLRLSVGTVFLCDNKPWLRFWVEASGMLIFTGLSLLLSKGYSYHGFLYALIISEWCVATVGVFVLLKKPMGVGAGY